ncbi:hypothetical protein [Micromonospora fluostatini]|uniref:hypothetical protein n=1 Tax=Micromonospora sp. JCM 30529 TaxID=3421643 RepID=UPI003D18578C
MMDVADLQQLPALEPVSSEVGLSIVSPCTVTCSDSCGYTCGAASCARTTVSPK